MKHQKQDTTKGDTWATKPMVKCSCGKLQSYEEIKQNCKCCSCGKSLVKELF